MPPVTLHSNLPMHLMRSILIHSVLALCVIVFSGCDSSDEDPETVELPIPQVVAEADYTITDSGLKYFDLTPGDTTFPIVETGQEVVVHYNAWLESGLMVESTVFFGGDPIVFILGAGQVIPGWEEGMTGMYPGGLRQLIIPPELAYDSVAIGNIPANSTLIYEIDYLGFLQAGKN